MTNYLLQTTATVVGALMGGPPGALLGGLFTPMLEKIAEGLGDRAIARIKGATRAVEELSYREKIELANLHEVGKRAQPQITTPLAEVEIDDAGWAWHFFKCASDAIAPEAQTLFAAALAGQYNGDGKTSARTLRIIRDMSSRDAEAFQKFSGVIIDDFVFYHPRWHRHIDGFYSYVLQMADLGLLVLERSLRQIETPDEFVTHCGTHRFRITPKSRFVPKNITLPVIPVTVPGRELCKLVATTPNDTHLRSLALYCKRRRHQLLDVTDASNPSEIKPLGQ